MNRTSTTLLWLLLVFASGITVGVVSHRYYSHSRQPISQAPPPKQTREQARQDFLQKMRDRVGVSEDQIQTIVKILDAGRSRADAYREQTDQEFRRMQEEMRAEIRASMRPEQAKKYDEWREERRRERERQEAEQRAAEQKAQQK